MADRYEMYVEESYVFQILASIRGYISNEGGYATKTFGYTDVVNDVCAESAVRLIIALDCCRWW